MRNLASTINQRWLVPTAALGLTLACMLAATLASATARAARAPRVAEASAIKHAVLTSPKSRLPYPPGAEGVTSIRISTVSATYSVAEIVGVGKYKTVIQSAVVVLHLEGRRWQVIDVGGQQSCTDAPMEVLRDLLDSISRTVTSCLSYTTMVWLPRGHLTNCRSSYISKSDANGLGTYTRVDAVVGMTCAAALAQVQRPRNVATPASFTVGGSFDFGRFSCIVQSASPEHDAAECTTRTSAFVIDYR